MSELRNGVVTAEVYLGRTEDERWQRWRWDVTVRRHGVHQYTEFGYAFLRAFALWRIGRSLAQVQDSFASVTVTRASAR